MTLAKRLLERRREDRYALDGLADGFWMPGTAEVVVQFLTRYLFFVLAVLFFVTAQGFRPVLLSRDGIFEVLAGYALLNSVLLYFALRRITLTLLRLAMLMDLALVTLCLIHDPYSTPPSALAYLMVIFGNGMRYGMRLFAEAIAASFVLGGAALAVRYRAGGFELGPGDVFFGIFWVTLVVYAYRLMGRVDAQRALLDRRSCHDSLTGVLNRHGLIRATRELFARDEPLDVIFADLNHFKHVNDLHGHGTGDRVLAEFAALLKAETGSTCVGRWGGDEFVALVPAQGEAAGRQLRQRIADALARWAQAQDLPVSVCLGTSHYPRHGRDLDTLLSVADLCMYREKSQARLSGLTSAI